MTPKKKKTVKVTERMCKTCDHEETYHKGRGFLRTLSCMVTGCKCKIWVFGYERTLTEEVYE